MTPVTPVTRWQAEAIWEAVAPTLPGFTVEVLPEIDSTNTELMRRARAGQHEPTLLVAERQTAGRGRMGRVWDGGDLGDAGELPSLMFSLGLPLAPRDWSGLSLAVGVCVAESLDPAVRLKWPNDLWLADDRKLGGILVETASVAPTQPGEVAPRYVVIGIGMVAACPIALPRCRNWCRASTPQRRWPVWPQRWWPPCRHLSTADLRRSRRASMRVTCCRAVQCA